MKTTHQFAEDLLNGPNMPVAVMSAFLDGGANQPGTSVVEMEDGDGNRVNVLVISAAITLTDRYVSANE